jgi:hypothetical protein
VLLAGDPLDNLEILLSSVLLTEYLRVGAVNSAEHLTAVVSPYLGPALDGFLDVQDVPPSALSALWRLDVPSPVLLKRIWAATETNARPSPLTLFEMALCEKRYGAAQSALAAFSSSERDRKAFAQYLNRRDEAGNTT